MDPLNHTTLSAARDTAASYVTLMGDTLPRECNPHALLMAFATMWKGLCDMAGIDPTDAFEQVSDMIGTTDYVPMDAISAETLSSFVN